MPKLLFLVTEDWYFVSHRLPLAIAALREGFDVTVVTRCRKHCGPMKDLGLRVIPFEMNRRGLSPLTLAWEAAGLARLYRREQPDIVHHVALRPVVAGAIAARIAGVPNVISAVTGLGFLFTDGGRVPLVRRVLQRFLPWLMSQGLVIVQNPDDSAMLVHSGMPANIIRLIPGAGVDAHQFAPAPEYEGQPMVMLASRLLWDKGVGEFVEVARMLRDRGVRFVLVGEPDSDNPASVTEADVNGWLAEGVVEWWGHQENMAQTLRMAHIVCLPSYREGLPKVLLEAMACGKACVATDAPGCREAVRHGDNGLLVPIKNARALAAAIVRLLDDPEERACMGARGRERAVAEFCQERVIEATLEIYRELLS